MFFIFRGFQCYTFRWLSLLIVFAAPPSAWAAATCSGGGQAYTVAMPATVSIPRNAPDGTVLAAFNYSAAAPNIWSCRASGSTATGAGFKGNNGAVATYTVAGKSVPVHSTSIPGVGIAFDVKENANGCGWLNGNENQNPKNGYAWGACNANGNVVNGLQVGVALVKTGSVTPGLLNPGVVGYGAAYNAGVIPAGGASQVSYGITPVQITVLSCTTPNVSVPMGQHKTSEFTGTGKSTKSVNFNINLDNCPGGLGNTGPAIQYRLDPTSAVLVSSQSVVAVASGGATGLGLQLLDGNGVALPLSTYKAFNGYSGATGGSYTIPLQARYYQTAAAVTPGPANAAITLTMLYQ